jgi:2-polyprenyl-6-hydroxyphenyl methylase/3-demethylubiquinone-9 3-methyltransferase
VNDKDDSVQRTAVEQRARNDPAQYDELSDAWWDPAGPFVMLHWIAAARAERIPAATRCDAILVDLGCGGGLLAPHLEGKGYTHVGFDLTHSALTHACDHDVLAVQSDVGALPLPDGVADVVVAGEILEHVDDLSAVLREACRVLRPGGTFVLDTVADTALARLLVVTVAERIPRGAPKGIHDPRLFVNRRRLVALCAGYGVDIVLTGLRPTAGAILRGARRGVKRKLMISTRSTAVLYQGVGKKRP